jgi:hypothetical protein
MADFSCSFCGKAEREVERLVSGPGVFICDDCLTLCNEITSEPPASAGPTMEHVRTMVARLAPASLSVLICGARGAGKSFFANLLHKLSGRPGDLVTVNCAALEDKIEIDLFGALDAADGGTVYLKHVDRLSPIVQSKLLTAVEAKAGVRFISATRQDLEASCNAGVFLPRLFFRLSGMILTIPPLRQRPDEVPALVNDLLGALRAESGREAVPRITAEAMERLCRYPWPGNVGQLATVLTRALRLCDGPELSTEDLTIDMPAPFARSRDDQRDFAERASGPASRNAWLEAAERQRILEALATHTGVRPRKPPRPEPIWSKPGKGSESACSLCGQSYGQVRMLFRGSDALICDACVGDAQTAIGSAARRPCETAETNRAPTAPPVHCAFCAREEADVGRLVGTDDRLICDTCLDLCDCYLGDQAAVIWPKGPTLTMRACYPSTRVAEVTDHARRSLLRGDPCRIVVLVEDGKTQEARAVLDQVKGSIADLANYWEPTPNSSGNGLTMIAMPRPTRPTRPRRRA